MPTAGPSPSRPYPVPARPPAAAAKEATPEMTEPTRPRLHGWTHPAILSAAALSVASGFAQFSATATLGDIARAFGEVTDGSGVAAQAGLAGTTLGVGLALIRLASLAALPIAALADRLGRRRVLLACSGLGLAITALAALSPGFWWFVAIFALGRPLLSATNAVAGVIVAEETSTRHRAKGMALLSAAYGTGAGITALIRGPFGGLGFRGVFALTLVPLALLPVVARRLHEPDRYLRVQASEAQRPRLGHLRPELRPRLVLLGVLTFGLAFVTGPVNSLLFVFAENVVGLPPTTTAAVVLAAAPIGLSGLLLGRWAADRIGRRRTAALGQALVAVGGMVTYSGAALGAIGGYLASIFVASALAPALGALTTELFPTSARATAAGWLTVAGVLGAVTGLVAFGALADLVGFAGAALAIAAPVAAGSALYLRLPETMGRELEESAPDAPGASGASGA